MPNIFFRKCPLIYPNTWQRVITFALSITYAETEKPKESAITGQEEEGLHPHTVEGEHPTQVKKEKVPHEVLLGGVEGGDQAGHGEDAEEEGQEIEGGDEPSYFYKKNSPNVVINYNHSPSTVLLDKNVANDNLDNIEPFEDIMSEVENLLADINTIDVASTVNVFNSTKESFIKGTVNNEIKKKVHMARIKHGKSKNNKKGGG